MLLEEKKLVTAKFKISMKNDYLLDHFLGD